VKEKLSETTPYTDEDEVIFEPTFQIFSFEFNEENLSMMQQHTINPLPQVSKQQVQNTLSNPIIRPWE
jgi:GAF domain-containing protein